MIIYISCKLYQYVLIYPNNALLQVLGLHLPVVKLCFGSASCVIENRLESEDSELESRLMGATGGRHHNTGSKQDTNATPLLAIPAVPILREGYRRSSTVNRLVPTAGSAISRQDLPLSHTWHGGAPNLEGGSAESGFEGRGNGQQTAKMSKSAGNRESRDLNHSGGGAEGYPTTPSGLDAAASATAESGTPSKAVKFLLGRTRAGSASISPQEHAVVGSNDTGSATASRRSSVVPSSGCDGDGSEETVDQRGSLMNVIVQACFWADYFNNTLRCWEALLDPFRYCFCGVRCRHL